MFASYPLTPSESTPSTPSPAPRRRIRCKMCRQELATREHMLDHGQLGPATPAAMTPAVSRRPSEVVQQRPSFGQSSAAVTPGMAAQRRPSRSRLSFSSGLGDTLTMSTIDPAGAGTGSIAEEPGSGAETAAAPLVSAERLKNFRTVSRGMMDSSLTMTSAVEDDDDEEDDDGTPPAHIHVEAAKLLGRRLSAAVMTPVSESTKELAPPPSSDAKGGTGGGAEPPAANQETMTTHLISPANLAAQLYANPKLAALRSPSFGSASAPSSSAPSPAVTQPKPPVVSPPIIINPKCSGYFVEPVRQILHFYFSRLIAML